jgi:asparagine N-glycosylation enzyme membrane subunit Stt3
MNQKTLYGLLALALAVVACSPVIAISWNEFLIIGAIVAVLLGPPLYRFIRRVDDFRRNERKHK